MNRMTVVYDETCEFCVRCRWWLARQPSYVDLDFMPRMRPDLHQRFPGLQLPHGPAELLVITDQGDVYTDAHAWIMCLWALVEYREWAERLSTPALLPFAGAFFKQVSKRRHWLSALLAGANGDHALECALRPQPHAAPHCATCRGSPH